MAYHKKPRNEDDDLEDLLRKADQVLGETPPEEAEEDAPLLPGRISAFYANYSNQLMARMCATTRTTTAVPTSPGQRPRRKPPGLPFQPTTWIFKTRTAVSPAPVPS